MLAGRGYAVTAISWKSEAAEYLRTLGAEEILDRRELERSALGSREAAREGEATQLTQSDIVRPFCERLLDRVIGEQRLAHLQQILGFTYRDGGPGALGAELLAPPRCRSSRARLASSRAC